MSNKWANLKSVSIEVIDEIIEAGEVECIRLLPMDGADADRIIQYLEGAAALTQDSEAKAKLEDICFDLALSHGDLSTALRLAINPVDEAKISEVFRLCFSLENRPGGSRYTAVVASSSGYWPASARVCYDVQGMDAERLATESRLRKALQIQFAYQIARHRLNFPVQVLLGTAAAPEEVDMTDNTEPPTTEAPNSEQPNTEESNTEQVSPGKVDELVSLTPSVPELRKILSREYMANMFGYLAKELDVQEVRKPDDVFKTELEEGRSRRSARGSTGGLDAGRQALASAYVSGFVHSGFRRDALLLPEDSAHIHKARANGITAAIGGIGLISLWNVEEGLNQIDKFQYSSDPFTRAGAFLAFGLNSANVSHECDPVLTLVADGLNSDKVNERLAAIVGLGYAYAGTSREEVSSSLVPILLDLETVGGLEVSAAAALTLGFVFVGSADESLAEAMLQTMIERAELETGIDTTHAFNLAVGFALIFLERKDDARPALASLQAVNHPLGEFTRLLTEACAYAATGDVEKTQEMIETCINKTKQASNTEGESNLAVQKPAEVVPATETTQARPDEAASATAVVGSSSSTTEGAIPEEEATVDPTEPAPPPQVDPSKRVPATPTPASLSTSATAAALKEEFVEKLPGLAVFALPLLALREDIGHQMTFRFFNHFLQFDGLDVRRAVPVALMLHAASNPEPAVVDLLSKLSHDPDADTALHAIVALGVVGMGTNNSRVALLLRQLASYYVADSNALFLVRVSQGLLYSGKGLISISPFHSDRTCIDRVALSGLIAFCVQALFTRETLCQARYHLNVYHLVLAIHPRWLITLDENQEPVQIPVRIGQALDTAGLAGEPKRITGFRVHNTPVLLAFEEKAQIGSDEWQALTEVCEGIVIVRKLKGREKSLAAKSLE